MVTEEAFCSICQDRGQNVLRAECGDRFCASCVSKHIKFTDFGKAALCPNCRAEISELKGEPPSIQDVFNVRYKNIHFRGLQLQEGQDLHQLVGELFGLDASKLWRLRLICRGALVDVNTRPRQLGQQPLLMVVFSSEDVERGMLQRASDWFSSWWTEKD